MADTTLTFSNLSIAPPESIINDPSKPGWEEWLAQSGEEKTEDEEWDDLLALPESQEMLNDMAAKAREDYHAGRTSDFPVTES